MIIFLFSLSFFQKGAPRHSPSTPWSQMTRGWRWVSTSSSLSTSPRWKSSSSSSSTWSVHQFARFNDRQWFWLSSSPLSLSLFKLSRKRREWFYEGCWSNENDCQRSKYAANRKNRRIAANKFPLLNLHYLDLTDEPHFGLYARVCPNLVSIRNMESSCSFDPNRISFERKSWLKALK